MKYALLLSGLLAVSAAAPVAAHTPYLAPGSFEPQAQSWVTLDAAFAETFFVPDAAFDHSRPVVVAPDGSVAPVAHVQVLHQRTVLEHQLPAAKGTYRFSTGPRLGAVFRTWELDGKRGGSRDADEPLPKGAKLLSHFQSLTLAETYLSVGAPDRGALAPYGKGLELVPITHPSDLYAGENFAFEVRFDGKPLAAQTVEFTEAVWTGDRTPETLNVTTDAAGRATFKLGRAGTWLALTRHRSPAPQGAAAPEYSNSYSLAFRVLNP